MKREARARIIVAASLGVFASRAQATEIHVATRGVERVAGSDAIQVAAHVTWKNAWRNARNYDAAWLFLKMRVGPNGGWTHVRLRAISSDSANPGLTCSISADHVGAFCAPAATHRGSVSARVKLEVDMTGVPGARANVAATGRKSLRHRDGVHPGRALQHRR